MNTGITNGTFNYAVEAVKLITLNHKMMKEFHYGNDLLDFSIDTFRYPLCFMQPGDANVKGGKIELTFSIMLMDQLDKERTLEQEIHSNMLSIAVDYLAELNRSEKYNFLLGEDDTFSLSPFTEYGDDNVAGWNLTLVIDIKNNRSNCSTPIEDFNF